MAMREILQNPVLHIAKLNHSAIAYDSPKVGIQLKVTDSNNAGVLAFSAANQCLAASDKLTHIKRLTDVVVGARIQQCDYGLLLVTSGENENRCFGAMVTITFKKVETAQPR